MATLQRYFNGLNKTSLNRGLRVVTLFVAVALFSSFTVLSQLSAHTVSPDITAPIIRWDSAGDPAPPGPINGVTTFTPGGAPGTGVLSMAGSIVSFTPKKKSAPLLVGGNVSIYAALEGVSVSAGLVHGDFGTMVGSGFPNPNPTGYDVEVVDSDGVLALGGNLEALTIDGIFGSNIGSGGAILNVLDGYLKRDFRTREAGIVHLEFNAVPSWSATSFDDPWTSESKGDIGHMKAEEKKVLGAYHKIVARPYIPQESGKESSED